MARTPRFIEIEVEPILGDTIQRLRDELVRRQEKLDTIRKLAEKMVEVDAQESTAWAGRQILTVLKEGEL